MLTPDEAWCQIARHLAPPPPSLRTLDDLRDHVLAEPIGADRDMPATDRSAMDGFAYRARDVGPGPTVLRVIGEIAAGAEPDLTLGPGECVRIFTGAALPAGADTVAMIETSRIAGENHVELPGPARPGSNVLLKGEDARRGEILLPPGVRLNAGRVALCAAAGRRTVLVHERPRVAIVTTGRELLSTDEQPLPHQIRDSNSALLAAALNAESFPVPLRRRAPDVLDAIVAALDEALLSADVVLLSGGVSVGDYDFVPEAVLRVGARVILHGVAMKPGKPTLFATGAGRKAILGLPGNPLATLTVLHELGLPVLRRLSGLPPEECRPTWRVRLAGDLHSRGGRHRYHPARLAWQEAGPVVDPVVTRSSSDLVAGGRADGAVIAPPDTTHLPAGTVVSFRPWRPLA